MQTQLYVHTHKHIEHRRRDLVITFALHAYI